MRVLAIFLALILSIAPVSATTIAWDGKRFACDTQVTRGHLKYTCQSKIHYSVIRDEFIGFAGDLADIQKVMVWFLMSKEMTANLKGNFTLIIVPRLGPPRLYQNTLRKFTPVMGMCAIGSGGCIARAAMMTGKNATEAVLEASKEDIYTNNQVIEFILRD